MKTRINRWTPRISQRNGVFVSVLLLASPVAANAQEMLFDHVCTGRDDGSRLSRPLGIFFDATRSECYVADTGNNEVLVCDDHGSPLFRFKHFVQKQGLSVLGEPRSIVVDANGLIFVTDDVSKSIDVLDPTGRSVATIATPPDACDTEESFELLALGRDGVYASLSCPQRRVAVIGEDLRLSRTIALGEADTSEVACITGLAVDGKGGIYVTDACASEMVRMYDADGKLVRAFGNHETGLENFSFASGIAVMDDGTLWVVDTLRHLVSHFTPEGQRLATVGGKGTEPGAFEFPSCISTDGAGRIFVAERAGNRYQCFRFEDGVLGSDLSAGGDVGVLLEQSQSD